MSDENLGGSLVFDNNDDCSVALAMVIAMMVMVVMLATTVMSVMLVMMMVMVAVAARDLFEFVITEFYGIVRVFGVEEVLHCEFSFLFCATCETYCKFPV